MSLIPENNKVSYSRTNNAPIRKLFVSQINDESEVDISNEQETFRVFLRIKPIRLNHDLHSQKNTINIVNSTTLICKPPSTSKYKKAERVEYIFSHIFGPKATQQDIFLESIVPCIEDLLNCRNSLVFTYGTTNAGKTYTVQGSILDPGIIPRTLHTVFTNVRPDRNVIYAPYMARNILKLDKERSIEEICFKEEILRSYNNISKFSKGVSNNGSNSEYNQFLQILEENYVELKNNMPLCSVWISFIELYNETIFDLLEVNVHTRKPLKLSADKHDNFYVKGLKHVCVQSAEEAYSIYKYGKKNLNVACTKMNETSSRSHCIFTIKLINHQFQILSNLSICDLAGTERQAKAQNVGIRLKESGIINGSLFQLNRCLRTIRENQNRNVCQLIPYRHSNLTKLFHSAFDERTDEKIVMIVNINPSPELYDETQQVLKMCAVASKIKNKPVTTKMLRQSTRFTTYVYGNDTFSLNDDDQQCDNEDSDYEEDFMESSTEYQKEINRLKELVSQKEQEIISLRDRLKESSQIYIQMENNFNQHLDATDERIKEQQESFERRFAKQKEYYEWKLVQLRKNVTLDSELERDWKTEIFEKDMLIEELKLQLLKKNDDRNSLTLLVDQQTELKQKDDKIKELSSLLEEGKTEYIALVDELKSSLNKLSDFESILHEKNEFIEGLEQNLQYKQNILDEFEERNDNLKETLYENAIEHERILAKLEKQWTETKEENEKLKKELSACKDEQDIHIKTITQLEQTNTNLHQQLEEIQDKNKQLEDKLQQMEEANKIYDKNITEKIQFLKDMEKICDEYKNENKELKKKLINKEEQKEGKRYNTRGNRTPLKQLDKENKYFNYETPKESIKKTEKINSVSDSSKKTKTKLKENLLDQDLFDDSLELEIFRIGKTETKTIDKENNVRRKKKLFSTSINNSENLISLDSAEKEKKEYEDPVEVRSKPDIATPAETVKAALRKKKIN